MGPLLALTAASAIGGAVSSFGAASAQKKAAASRAASLQIMANRRLAKGKQEAELADLKGGADRTTEFSNIMSRGGSREAMLGDLSLGEIADRAKFAHDQALSDAQFDAGNMLADGNAMVREAADAATAMRLGAVSSVLGAGSSYLTARYGNGPNGATSKTWSQLFN